MFRIFIHNNLVLYPELLCLSYITRLSTTSIHVSLSSSVPVRFVLVPRIQKVDTQIEAVRTYSSLI